jgi:hypothetical protein
MANSRDDFDPKKVVEPLAKRSSYVCTNPDCRALTIAPSEIDTSKYIYVGVASHITAAASGGPRYDSTLTTEQRSSIDNAIFLCSTCSVMIDKNNGLDFPKDILIKWKNDHEIWVRSQLNKSVTSLLHIVDGEHHASGIGNVTGLEIHSPTIIKPGTKVTAEGIGNITGTKIGG